MASLGGHSQACRDFSDALGLECIKHITSVNLDMTVGEVVSVTVKYYPEEKGVIKAMLCLKKFHLTDTGDPEIIERLLPTEDGLIELSYMGTKWKKFVRVVKNLRTRLNGL